MKTPKVLAIIPARGGSKGIPNKNMRLLRGKPLIQHAIDYAKSSSKIQKTIVSTDSSTIADFSKKQNVDVVMRPESISGDKSLVIDAIRYTLNECETVYNFYPDIIILLECTSPIKSVEEIDKSIDILANYDFDSVTTFKETDISPNRIWKIENNSVAPFINGAQPFLPRQVQPKGYQLTGQLYSVKTDILKNNPDEISLLLGKTYPIITKTEVVDIDNEIDLIIAEKIIENNKN